MHGKFQINFQNHNRKSLQNQIGTEWQADSEKDYSPRSAGEGHMITLSNRPTSQSPIIGLFRYNISERSKKLQLVCPKWSGFGKFWKHLGEGFNKCRTYN